MSPSILFLSPSNPGWSLDAKKSGVADEKKLRRRNGAHLGYLVSYPYKTSLLRREFFLSLPSCARELFQPLGSRFTHVYERVGRQFFLDGSSTHLPSFAELIFLPSSFRPDQKSVSYSGTNHRLRRVLRRALAGEAISLAVIGGSSSYSFPFFLFSFVLRANLCPCIFLFSHGW